MAWVQMCNTRDSVALNVDGPSPLHAHPHESAVSETTLNVLACNTIYVITSRPHRFSRRMFHYTRALAVAPTVWNGFHDSAGCPTWKTIPKLKTPVFQTIIILLNCLMTPIGNKCRSVVYTHFPHHRNVSYYFAAV